MSAIIPCFGGPYDGKFYDDHSPPIGYRKFPVRARWVYLWRSIDPDFLNFNILAKASKLQPEVNYEELDEDSPGSTL